MAKQPQKSASDNTPPPDIVETVDDTHGGGSDPSAEQLQQAMIALNAAADGPVDPDTLQPIIDDSGADQQGNAPTQARLPENVRNRMEIANAAGKRRMNDMIGDLDENGQMIPTGQQPGQPQVDQVLTEDGQPLNMNAQTLYYGQFGDPNKTMMGDDIVPVAPAPVQVPQEPAQEEQLYTVKVEGEEMQVTQDELIRSYQKDAAASRRLQEATALLQSAQNTVAAQPVPTAPVAPAGQVPAPSTPTGPVAEPGLDLSDMDFAGLAEQIQYGDTAEGAQALENAFREVATRALSLPQAQPQAQLNPDQMAAAVQDRLQSQEALTQFSRDYPDIVADDLLYDYAGRHAVEAMIEDFVAAGADDAMVQQARANPQQAIQAHRAARLSGQFTGLRSPSEIYRAAGDKTRAWVAGLNGRAAPPQQQLQPGAVPVQGNPNAVPQRTVRQAPPRAERARTAQQSPNLRQAPAVQTQEAPRPLTRSEKVMQMKRARGQLPAGQR